MPDTLYAADRSAMVPEPPTPMAALTARVITAVCVRFPDVPVTVTAANPVAATLLATNTTVRVVAVLPGLTVAVTPLGTPANARVTWPGKPFTGVIVMVLLAAEPWLRNTLLGAGISENPGSARVK